MIQFLKNVTPNQWFAITIAVLSALAGATAQLTDLFGASVAHGIVSGCTLLTTILSGTLVSLTSQGAQIRNVQAMPGVDKIVANKEANQTLAQFAVDPNSKVEPLPEAAKVVAETATGHS